MVSLEMQLDWLPNAQFAGILWAHSAGWYRQAGIDLQILGWEACTNQMDALESERMRVVSTEDNLLIRARATGAAVRAIGAMMQFSGIGWMSLAHAGINSFADLRGRRLGIHRDGEAALELALDSAGMRRSDLEVVEVGYEYANLLSSGEFDAMQCLLMVEPLEMEEAGYRVNTLRGYDMGYKVYSQVIATTDRLLEEEEAMLEDFLQITFAGWRAAFDDPERSAGLIAAEFLPGANPALQERMLVAMQPIFPRSNLC